MPDLRDLKFIKQERQEAERPGLEHAVVASTPADHNDEVFVILPEFSNDQTWGPYRWVHNGGDMPQPGDDCLVAFSNRREGWVISYWSDVYTPGDAAVTSVFGRSGDVSAAPGDYTVGQVTGAESSAHAAATYAPLASPAFTGAPTAPTPLTADNSTAVATTAFVKAQGYITSSPVTSVFGRAGAVTAATGDYTAAQVTNAADKASSANQAFTAPVGSTAGLAGGAYLQGASTYAAGNNWMTGMVGAGIYFDGTNWQNKTFGGNNGWAAIGVRGASNPGGIELYGVNATGAVDRSYTPAQFLAQKFGSWTTDGTLTTLGRVFSGAAGTGGMWVDGGSSQFFGSVDASNVGIYNAGWWFKIGSSGQTGFFAATPAAQQTAHGVTVNTRGVGTTWLIDNTTTGGVGSTAYTIQDIVAALKNYGLLVA